MKKYYAHTDGDRLETLEEHLRLTAKYAKQFGEEFGQGEVCEQLGLLHDVGKHTKLFQDILFHRNGVHKIDHAVVGGKYFYDNASLKGFNKAYFSAILASHHSKLGFNREDLRKYIFDEDEELSTGKRGAVSENDEMEEIEEYIQELGLDKNIDASKCLDVTPKNNIEEMAYARMLFSCLVDADYTATSEFYNNDYFKESEPVVIDTEKYLKKLEDYRNNMISGTDQTTGINKLRSYVYSECSKHGKKADKEFYTLNAPTGTAKTLALIKFALECAKNNNQKRIFIILPYLSIIKQNADIYKEIFGEDVVLEDDSSVEYDEQTKLYSERWSSPIIVTTSVKFFETMFKAKASELRRLHQVANAVIVFDECQTLPPTLTDCTLQTLNCLTRSYNSTILFSTATLPSYNYRKKLKFNSKEIISDVDWLYKEYDKLKNTVVCCDFDCKYNSEKLFDKFKDNKQVLYIFNTIQKATDMFAYLTKNSNGNVYLITSNMCSKHKLDVIKKVKDKLKNNECVYLCSTQTVEIGVDIDFPICARELAPLDSIVQTSGRVNRNCKKDGYLFVFEHEDDTYPGSFYENCANITKMLFENTKKEKININDVDMMEEYYKKVYSLDFASGDMPKLNDHIWGDGVRTEENWFENVDNDYKLINSRKNANIIVAYEGCMKEYDNLVNQLSKQNYCITAKQMKQCKNFCVNLSIDYLTDRKKAILEGCTRLNLRLSNGQAIESDWYIAPKNMYDDSGIHINNENVLIF